MAIKPSIGFQREVVGNDLSRSLEEIRKEREKREKGGEDVFLLTHAVPPPHGLLVIYLIESALGLTGRHRIVVVEDETDTILLDILSPLRTLDDLRVARIIPVLIGDGLFSTPKKEGKPLSPKEVSKETSVVRRAARALGLLQNLEYRALVMWAEGVELEGAGPFNQIAGALRTLSLANAADPNPVYCVAREIFNARRADLMAERMATREANRIVFEEVAFGSEMLKFGYVQSDRTLMSRVARERGAQVFVQEDAQGQTFISALNPIPLNCVVALLRLAETEVSNIHIPDERARESGLAGERDPWFFEDHSKMHTIINGGYTAPKRPRSNLMFETKVNLVKTGLQMEGERRLRGS